MHTTKNLKREKCIITIRYLCIISLNGYIKKISDTVQTDTNTQTKQWMVGT